MNTFRHVHVAANELPDFFGWYQYVNKNQCVWPMNVLVLSRCDYAAQKFFNESFIMRTSNSSGPESLS